MAFILGVCMFFQVVYAKDFGVLGTIYPVIEDSLLDHLSYQLSKISSEVLAFKQLEIQEKIKKSVLTPPAVQGLRRATTYQILILDPSIRLDKDILDHQGHVIAKKNSTYNPLASLQLKASLLIFDGTDLEQIKWAEKQGSHVKWVLTSGQPFKLMKKYNRIVYFDQEGTICKRFNITNTPALIRQKGQLLEIHIGWGNNHAH